MNSQRGFTLVEALVAGVISTIIPAVILSVLNINATTLLETSNRARLARIQDVVSEEIRRSADTAGRADLVCTDGTLSLGAWTTSGVLLCNAAGVVTQRGFRVVNLGNGTGRLEEGRPGTGWVPFVVGEDTVRVTWAPSTGKAPGLFGVGFGPYSLRFQGFYFNMRLNMPISGVTTALAMQTESVICRNADPW